MMHATPDCGRPYGHCGLVAELGPAFPSSDLKPAPAAPRASPEDRAERRQVTVMFADLVGSTALSGRVDPEDLREVISSYHRKCVAETVQRFDGFVAKYMGDGVLVYFGCPQNTKTMQSKPCARGWNWSRQSAN